MIYVMSDLHGCYEAYIAMLKKIRFSAEDTLYILGDVVDRGPSGIKILLDMMERKNVIPLLGNHDYTAKRLLEALFLEGQKYHEDKLVDALKAWTSDGGDATLKEFAALKSDEKIKVLKYLNAFLIYEEIETGGVQYFLSHTVPEKEKMQEFETCKWQDFTLGEPDYELQYFDDLTIVTGHTPTGLIEEKCNGKIYQKNGHIAVDCGAVFGGKLGCICLDTLEKFYV